MEWIDVLEKPKHPFVALVTGILLGVSATWTVITNIHEERVKTIESTIAELERQIAFRDKTIEQKNAEITALSMKLSTRPTAESSHSASSAELQEFIAQIDAEIEKKKAELAMSAGSLVVKFSERERDGKPKSEAYSRIEQELQALSEQRNAARQRLIDGMNRPGF